MTGPDRGLYDGMGKTVALLWQSWQVAGPPWQKCKRRLGRREAQSKHARVFALVEFLGLRSSLLPSDLDADLVRDGFLLVCEPPGRRFARTSGSGALALSRSWWCAPLFPPSPTGDGPLCTTR